MERADFVETGLGVDKKKNFLIYILMAVRAKQ
jgi:hypothetical protein